MTVENHIDQAALLVVHRLDRARGPETKEAVEDLLGDVPHSRFYHAVNRLTDRGLVEKRHDKWDVRAKVYDTTEEGAEEAERYLEWLDGLGAEA